MEGLRSKDFVLAAFDHARELHSVSDRCKAIYQLHIFLKAWDPTSFELETRKVKRVGSQRPLWAEDASKVRIEQSTLAHDCGHFPDDLFGAYAVKVRSLFGYSPSIDSSIR